ncbi:MAG: hypothetical protein AB1633_01070 [Elusimicrobiota bacterium]
MGTTTFFLRHNDSGKPLNKMSQKELEKLNSLSPYEEEPYYLGWRVPLELHNGNVYVLVFWQGRLMKIEDAPKVLTKKYYSRFRYKEINKYEWTVLKKYISVEIQRLDKEFKKSLHRNNYRKKQKISENSS